RRDAIGNDGTLDVGNDGLDVWFVEAEDGRAVEGDAIDELSEGILDVFQGVILVEVFAVDGGDHGDDGSEKKKGTVAFVSFNDEMFAFPELGGRTGVVDFAADNESGVEMGRAEDGSDN